MKEDELIWPIVILVGLYLLSKAMQTNAALQLAQLQANVAEENAANNNIWANVGAGTLAFNNIATSFSNLFDSSD